MRNPNPARWAFGLVLLAIAAAVWWQWRTAPSANAPLAQAPSNAAVSAPVTVGPLLSVAPATSLRATGTNDPVIPADPAFPHRVRNTEEPMETLARNDRAILLVNALIDTGLKARLGIPEHLQAKSDPGSYIVQSRGVINEAFRDQLKAAGAEIIAYIPNNAYLIRVGAQGAGQLARMPATRAVLPYEPYYKLQESLLPFAVDQAPIPLSSRLRLTFFPGDMASAREKVEKLGAIVLAEDRSPFGPQLIVHPNKDSLPALASLTEVQTIESQKRRVLMNDLSRVRVGVSSNSGTLSNYRGLTGDGIMVSINDSGMDTNHPGLAGRVSVGLDSLGNQHPTNDLRGHGTHVGYTIAGSGSPGPSFTNNFYFGSYDTNNFRGMAPQATLFAQDFRQLSDSQLAEFAARTNLLLNLKTNTLIANNSWGYEDSFDYDSSAAIIDAATRDAIPAITGSQSMLFVFAAGNSGFGDDSGLGGLANSVSSVAAAKNVIAVGASELLRYITNQVTVYDEQGNTNTIPWWEGSTDSSNEVAAFSSRGNTGIGREGQYGRAKPDVVAPGVMVISGRSTSWDTTNYYNPTALLISTYTNLVLTAGSTNNFSLFLPNGTTNLLVEVLDDSNRTSAIPNIEIYTNQFTVIPSSSIANLYGLTPMNIDIDTNGYGVWFYDLVNTNAGDVTVTIRESIWVTNNLGNYPLVLSNLNEQLAPSFRFENGTSMAAPVVSGVLALMQEFFEKELAQTNTSPALFKAMLINGARTLSQTYGHETKNIINYQGWGLVNLANSLPVLLATNVPRTSWPLQYFDQSPTNALATGQTHQRDLTLADTARPFPLRVTLVWTDPPGNPAASLKLVNDLDLVVSNRVTGEIFYGNDFPAGNIYSTGNQSSSNAVADFVNNVENVYLPGDLSANYTIYVVGRRVNVNAVTAHTNGIVQDYALVVSSGNSQITAPFALDQTPTLIEDYRPTVKYFTTSTNTTPFMGERVGAHPPLITTTNGTNVQWNFYVFTNNSGFTNVAFVSFLSPNLSGDPRINTYRDPDADIDLYVSTSSDLTNLTTAVISDCFANTLPFFGTGGAVSTNRGGSEYVLLTNAPANQVYFVGIKAEDQKAAEFGFLAVATLEPPFSGDETNGYRVDMFPVPAEIPDGSPEKPEGVQLFGIFPESLNVRRLVVTNDMTHDLFGDLVGTLEHENVFATLNNHSFISSTNQGGNVNVIYDDSDQGDIAGSIPSDGPGSLNNFIGQEATGLWMFTMIDNSPQFVGRVNRMTLRIETQNQSARNGRIGPIFGLQQGRSAYGAIYVPPGVVRVKFLVNSDPDNVFTGFYVKRGSLPSGAIGDFEYGTEAYTQLTNYISTADIPPLVPGVYYVQVMNIGGPTADYDVTYDFEYDLASVDQRTTVTNTVVVIKDDAWTSTNTAEVNITAAGQVAGVRVGVRIDHERPSDLVLRLISPDRSVLLVENRGGTVNTNGYGTGTNFTELTYTHFSENSTNLIKFAYPGPTNDHAFVRMVVPSLLATNFLEDSTNTVFSAISSGETNEFWRIVPTGTNQGEVNIHYLFYTAADEIRVFYEGAQIASVGPTAANGLNPVTMAAATDVNIATDEFTAAGHAYTDGDYVMFFGGSLPLGLVQRQPYIVVQSVAGATFKVSTTAGGTPVDLSTTGAGAIDVVQMHTLGPIPYSGTESSIVVVVNPGGATSSAGTAWDYAVELRDTLGVTRTYSEPLADQIGKQVAIFGTNLYVVGTTRNNSTNGIFARIGVPIESTAFRTNQTPYETFNWPNKAGGTRFNGIHVSTSNHVFVVGDSSTRTVDGVPPDKYTKGLAVRFPSTGFSNSLANLGSIWDRQVPSVPIFGATEVEELHAAVTVVEAGVEYLYVTGNGQDLTGHAGRILLAKLDVDGNEIWATNDTAGVTNVARGIATLANHIFVAGGDRGGAAEAPLIIKFDTDGNKVSQVIAPVAGEYNGLVAYEQYLYAVGYATNGSTRDFLITKYDEDLNEIWSVTYDSGAGDGVLNGVIAMGNRVFGVGSTANGITGVDGVLVEVFQMDGSLAANATAGYTGYTLYEGGANGTDVFNGVATDGSDLYVVGQTIRPGRTDSDVLIVRYHVKDDYLPEESLENFIGDYAVGTWRLEVIDTRADYNASTNVPKIIAWQLQIFLADTNATATFRLNNGTNFVGTLRGAQTNYFVVNVPLTASFATNTLTVISNVGGGTGLTMWYDPVALPTGTDVLLANVTTTAQSLISKSTSPQLLPGQRYFLAVVNTDPNTTNDYSLQVDFDSTATTYLVSGGPSYSGDFGTSASTYDTYQFYIRPQDNYATLELLNLTGDAEVRLRRGAPATGSEYDLFASFSGTNYGAVTIAPTAEMPVVAGMWYALVSSPSGPESTYTIQVRPPNHAPFLQEISDVLIAEGSMMNVQAFGWDDDVPVNGLAYSLNPGAPAGMTIDPSSGSITWVPSESQGPGEYTITVRLTDDGAPVMFAEQTFTVLVTEANNAPILAAATYNVSENVLFAPTIAASDSDLPANTLTFSLVNGPSGMSINATSGQISWTPGESLGGQIVTFTVRVSDNQTPALTSTRIYEVRVDETNTAPVFANIPAQTVNELSPFTLSNLASDPDSPANTVVYRFIGTVPSGMQIASSTGVITWTPSESQGPATYEVTVEAEDNGTPALKSQKTISIDVKEVNTNPVMQNITAQSAAEGSPWSLQLQVTDADLPANTLSYSLLSAPTGMSVSSSGLITWTPSEAQGPGSYSVTAIVADNGSPSLGASKNFTITVTEGNSAPSLSVIADSDVNELAALSIQASATDSDTPAQTLTYRFTGSVPAGLTIGSASGAITWTPTEEQGPAGYPVTVEVSDGIATASRSFTINVKEVNQVPVLGAVSNITVVEGLPVRLTLSATDADLPAQSLTYALEAGAPAGATINENTGAFEWITSEASPNNNSITIRVTDNGVPPLSATKAFTVTVVEVETNVVDLVSGIAVTNASRYTNGVVADIYRLNVTGQPDKLLFEAFNLNGDGDLLVRRGAHPTATVFDHSSTLIGTNREQVVVTGTDLSGEWFATVINRESTNITYSISGTIPVEVAGGAMLISTEGIKVQTPVFTPGDDTPEFSWTTVQGEKYQVEVSTDLTTWTSLTNIVVTGTTATFTDPTPYNDSAQRFYRIRQMPQ